MAGREEGGGSINAGTGIGGLDDRAVYPETVDVNIRQLDPIPAPRAFIDALPLDAKRADLVLRSRQAIRDILHGLDDRLLVIVGPCSIHDPGAALDYARRLAAVNARVRDRLLIVMRVYFEKPRTTVGWKGLINDPDLNGSFDIRKGMGLARRMLLDVLSLGLPAATEWLDPITPQYLSDAVSWGAIGARNTESQVHRELASGLSMPVGFKNSTDGNVQAAADSCYASAFRHHFLSINLDGQVIAAETRGNPDCHLILRGSSHGPNYGAADVRRALDALGRSKAGGSRVQGLLVDAAHGNCGKDELREAGVVEELAGRLAAGERGILGVMMESFIKGGHQDPGPLDQLVYGRSVTDACICWERTEELLDRLAGAVQTRRKARADRAVEEDEHER
ncbi:3-deoxy-7-phosphoheptulonate synthase [Bifidobacterium xylocopae]|uniref:Phospho-2-dehydro-3-deoxyheptonate aldolase n=1 Tax=Bifidobacterium xylocopae TaxID=2493119 RepID=A0A366KCA8_9BIFI|nr:3-deoxy-7-phosphoheptulonate synthase [Bifidobacterium xylocopae]RBP99360.1 3-deoxy-7-phosphoheptulonate synthase [Bifidobacterium xylocopae]